MFEVWYPRVGCGVINQWWGTWPDNLLGGFTGGRETRSGNFGLCALNDYLLDLMFRPKSPHPLKDLALAVYWLHKGVKL
jgi:hypothetical protein